MRLRLGFAAGFATGYYMGTKAGRERHEQLNRMLRKARRSDAFETATEKARAAADLGVERAKGLVEGAMSRDDGSQNPVSPAEAGPLTKGSYLSN